MYFLQVIITLACHNRGASLIFKKFVIQVVRLLCDYYWKNQQPLKMRTYSIPKRTIFVVSLNG